MNAHADKTNEKQSQFESSANSQMKSDRGLFNQFTDNRPETLTQRKLQEMAHNRTGIKQVAQLQEKPNNNVTPLQQPIQRVKDNTNSQIKDKGISESSIIQRKPADELFPFPPTVKLNTDIRLNAGPFEGYGYQVSIPERGDNKGDAIKKVSEFIAASNVGGGSSNNFMTMKNVTRIAETYGNGQPQISRAGTNESNVAGGDKQTLRQYEPYVVIVNCFYRSIQGLKRITLKYNFSKESYGYVTAIIDEDVYSEMFPGGMPRAPRDSQEPFNPYKELLEGRENPKGMDKGHILNMFDQNHEKTGDRNLMEIINQRPKDQTDPEDLESLARHREHFDSIAKFAGEGPRFQCVLNNMDRLSSTTRFTAVNTLEDGGFLAVTFEDLAALWRDFGNAYNIPNITVIAKLHELYDQKLKPENRRRIPINRIDALGGRDINLQA